jgi:hypothetical protein
MEPLLIPIGIFVLYILIIIFHKDSPEECKYLEIWWSYPMPGNGSLRGQYKFTNKPASPKGICGNMGLAYDCFDLYDYESMLRLESYRSGDIYLPEEVIQTAIKIHDNYMIVSCEY